MTAPASHTGVRPHGGHHRTDRAATLDGRGSERQTGSGRHRRCRSSPTSCSCSSRSLMFVPFIFSVVDLAQDAAARPTSCSPSSRSSGPRIRHFDAYRVVFDSDIERWFFNSAFVAVIWVFARAFTATMRGLRLRADAVSRQEPALPAGAEHDDDPGHRHDRAQVPDPEGAWTCSTPTAR